MALTRVFVDDAVLGRLPQVCAKDGVATTSHLTVDQAVGERGLGALWLLLLLGPVGWLVLVLVAFRVGGEHLVIEVPMSKAAYGRLQAARSVRNRGLALALGGGLAGVLLATFVDLSFVGPVLVLAPVVVGLAMAATGAMRVARESVTVSLDGSRRWVSLGRVHATFAAACDSQVRSEHAV